MKKIDLNKFDGFIISGGADINPELYDESALLFGRHYQIDRDKLEQEIINFAIQNNKSLFAICRGMQMINVTLGGSLYQEASEVLEGFLPSKSLLSKLIGRRNVLFNQDSKIYKIMGKKKEHYVNSIHHQAVNKLGKGLKISAKEENGLVQAIENNNDKKHFLIGVQWHPELMLHTKYARQLFRSFIKSTF